MPFGRMVQLQELAGAHQRVVLSFRCEGAKLGGKQFPSGGCMSSPRKRSSQCCLFFFFFFYFAQERQYGAGKINRAAVW